MPVLYIHYLYTLSCHLQIQRTSGDELINILGITKEIQACSNVLW